MGVFKLLILALCVAMATGRSPRIEPPERPVVDRPNISSGKSDSAGSADQGLYISIFFLNAKFSCRREHLSDSLSNSNV